MKAILKMPHKRPEIVEIENSLEALQEIVGGNIQEYPFYVDASVLCNEAGLSLPGDQYNTKIGRLHFFGPVLIVGTAEECYTDVPQPEVTMELLWPTAEHKKRPTPARAGR